MVFPDVFTSWPEEVDEMIVTDGEGDEEKAMVAIVLDRLKTLLSLLLLWYHIKLEYISVYYLKNKIELHLYKIAQEA